MVQGLAFLSKKSWHTKNLNNQEKVWIAEERKKAEARKTQELQKQIQQELEQQELDAIAGRTSRRDRGIDWMYEHGPTSETARQDANKKAEEYLLGKEFVAEGAPRGDLDVDNDQEGVNKVVSSASAAAASYSIDDASGLDMAPEPSVKERNEAFRLRFEDPMFLVAQRAADIERKVERKKQLLERVTGSLAVDKIEVDVETKKREEKKKRRDRGEKKSGKKRRRSPSSESASDSQRSEDRRYRRKSPPRRRDCSPSPRRHDRGRSNRTYGERSRDDSGQHSRSRASRHVRERSESPDNYRREGRKRDRRSRSRSRSPSTGGERERRSRRGLSHKDSERGRTRSPPSDRFDDRRRDRSPERVKIYHSEGRSGATDSRSHHREISDRYVDDRKPSASSQSNEIDVRRRDAAASDRTYGLQGAPKGDHRRTEKLGPDEELLRKRRGERRDQKLQMESASRRRRMTPEERAKALEEMERNARTYDEHRTTKLQSGHHRDGNDEDENDAGATRFGPGSATFLNDIQRQTYGVHHGISMQDRLQQNRNNHQRSHDARFL